MHAEPALFDTPALFDAPQADLDYLPADEHPRPAGQPLHEVTFVVVDLETTGGQASSSDITEIGAVKVRGGEVLGTFQTFVRPRGSIPAFISVLTGITDAMVASAPSPLSALTAFWEFAGDAVLVAHNAPFDMGFLKTVGRREGLTWPGPAVLDTVPLARKVIPRGEVANHKLATLARHVNSPVAPDHRALTDALATVDVLHALIARVGNLGMTTLEDLSAITVPLTPATRRKRRLADGLPTGAGVYIFRDHADRPLYIGTSVSVARRVRSYFTKAEKRGRMRDMLTAAERVTAIECATVLEAQVRELRLIGELTPPYNRRSTRPHRVSWVTLTNEAYPRLSVVRTRREDPGAAYLGPLSSSAQAALAVEALHEALRLRQCLTRLPMKPSPTANACLQADLGRCDAPCTGGISPADYAQIAQEATAALLHDAGAVTAALSQRIQLLAEAKRYEEAALARDRLTSYLKAAHRSQRHARLQRIDELVAARRRETGGWEFALIRAGRLAGASTSPPGAGPMPYVEALKAAAEVVAPGPGQAAAHPEEVDLLLRWLEQGGVRLIEISGEWSSPRAGAGGHLAGLYELLASTHSRSTLAAAPESIDVRATGSALASRSVRLPSP